MKRLTSSIRSLGSSQRFSTSSLFQSHLNSKSFSTFLHVSYHEKNQIKDLGARYDPRVKKWYVPPHLSLEPFEPWIKEYLLVSYQQKDQVKSLGAQWDFHSKRWYVKGRKNITKFNQWRIILLDIPADEVKKAIDKGAKYDGNNQYYIPYSQSNKEDFITWLPRLYLEVPAEESHIAQDHGAIWDNSVQRWYLYAGLESPELMEKYYHPPSPSVSSTPASQDDPVVYSSTDEAESAPFKLLFFDVETTGLPQLQDSEDGRKGKRYPAYTNLTAYDTSRVVQLSYLVCSFPSLEEISSHDSIIQCSNFTIENSHIHGITTEIALEQGIPFTTAIEEFISHCQTAKYLLAHNIPFDYHVLLSELHRHQLHKYVQEFQQFPRLCTMELTRKYLAENHGVTPSLKNLYEKVIGEGIEGHHNSLADVKNLYKAIKRLIEMEVIHLR